MKTHRLMSVSFEEKKIKKKTDRKLPVEELLLQRNGRDGDNEKNQQQK